MRFLKYSLLFFCAFIVFSQIFSIQLFFTHQDSLEKQFAAVTEKAQTSIDLAFYDISLVKMAKKLIEAKKRGVRVRIVSEFDNKNNDAIKALQQAQIPIVFDNVKSLMHNKFMIIDKKKVWTGSANLSRFDMRFNRNNVFLIENKVLAKEFEKEFLEMFEDKLFGTKSPHNTKTFFNINDIGIFLYFAPEVRVDKIIKAEILKAKKTIQLAAFAFTHKGILSALLKKRAQGVKLKILLDSRLGKHRSSVTHVLKEKKIPFTIYKGRGKLHHKFIVIDSETVLTGSFNFTQNATFRNDENLLVFKNMHIADEFEKEFQRCLNK